MKLRMIASALLIMILSLGISSKSEAAPWRGCYRPAVSVCALAVVVGGYYAHPHYTPVCYGRGYYGGHRHYR